MFSGFGLCDGDVYIANSKSKRNLSCMEALYVLHGSLYNLFVFEPPSIWGNMPRELKVPFRADINLLAFWLMSHLCNRFKFVLSLAEMGFCCSRVNSGGRCLTGRNRPNNRFRDCLYVTCDIKIKIFPLLDDLCNLWSLDMISWNLFVTELTGLFWWRNKVFSYFIVGFGASPPPFLS